MPRLASLWLPDLAIDRIRRSDRIAARREGRALAPLKSVTGWNSQHVLLRKQEPRTEEEAGFLLSQEHDSVEMERSPALIRQKEGVKPGHWRPGARWAREADAPELLRRHDGEGALVTAHRVGNQNLLAAVSTGARSLGLEPGTPLTKARILVPGLDVRPADLEGDAAWLARLGLFAARRWTPRAAPSGPGGLWLDLTGVAHLFGGEWRMCERILAFCRRFGFSARIAVADATGAAHALARFGGEPIQICPSGRQADAIAGFPLAALRLGEDALSRARRLGLERIGELIAMPRGPLQRRFGPELLTRLDQALGREAEPFDPIVPEEAPSVRLRFLEPIAIAEAIEEAAGEAMRQLVSQLRETALGVRRLALLCERVDGETPTIAIGTARATRDGAHLLKLLCARIETIDPGFGIDAVRLVAARVEPLAPQPIEGAMSGAEPAPDIAELVDLLANRLGARRLYRLGAVESDIPERSVRPVAPLGEAADWPHWPRPVRLLSPPEPVGHVMALHPDGGPMRFNWRGRAYRVTAWDGPERLYGEWWKRADETEAVRDYFQVEDSEGRRFWLFRKGDPEMPATGDMSWWIQGTFA